MLIKLKKCTIHISFYFTAIIVLMLALDKNSISFISFISMVLHETGHIAVLIFLSDTPIHVEFGIFGISLDKKDGVLSYLSEIKTVVAGPFVNYFIAAVLFLAMQATNSFQLLEWCIVNFFIALINSLPIDPLDGGRLLYFLIAKNFNETLAEKVTYIVSLCVLLPFMAVAFYFTFFFGNNPTLIIMAFYLVFLFIKRK